MTERFANYDEFFQAAFADKDGNGQKPFDYQRRLADHEKPLPALVNVPTGAGKTNAILGAWLWRRLQNPQSVGRRLVYCLPMRTLVEQTFNVTDEALKRLNIKDSERKDRFTVHKLLGGDVDNDWEHKPERECILIGTQDMLLSRALNRGYALNRFKWPLHFGLLNNDCLWVFDEVQLMSDGLGTTAQLAAFRTKFQTFGHAHSIWMSATLDREWLKMVDFKLQVDGLNELPLADADRANPVLTERLTAVKHLKPVPPDSNCRSPQGLAAFVKQKHLPGTQTLVVVNRVARARETFLALQDKYSGNADKPEIKLIHSRFRPEERKQWKQLFDSKTGEQDRIIVATQVVEAGVDISSRLLVTDLAPYASLVQRFGRCNRAGEFNKSGGAFVYWVDRPLDTKDKKLGDKAELDDNDRKRIAQPYAWEDLQRAQDHIAELGSASPADLPIHSDPYRPAHVLRRRDLVDLFDTTPDLSGYDLDVSRFVRGGDERDVVVAWRQLDGKAPLSDGPRLTRDELCPVGIGEFKTFLKGKTAWQWNALDGKWQKVGEDGLRPGLTLLLDSKAGGYDTRRGWDVTSKEEVRPVDPGAAERNEALNDDPQSWLSYVQTLAAHSREAREAAENILDALADLNLEDWNDEVIFATHHHDWGKAHHIFQETLHKGLAVIDASLPLAKSTSHARHTRKRFRHELASALALLQTGASELVVYLAACHHGKVRLSIRALPDETKPEEADYKFARGIWDNDELPPTDLGGVMKEAVKLELEPMLLGASATGQPSWLERMLALRDGVGIFRLAFLEALIRAADVRASQDPQSYWSKEEL